MSDHTRLRVVYCPRGRAREYAPLAANLYTGCGHGCKYCYVPNAMRIERGRFHDHAEARREILKKIERDIYDISQWGEYPPIFFSFATDPYNQLDQELQLMREVVKLIKSNGLSVQILTKSGLRATRDFDLLDATDAVASTLTFMDNRKSLEWEPRAALPKDRIELLRIAKIRGFKTWASLEPVIDPKETIRCIDASHEYVDLFKVGKLNHQEIDVDWEEFAESVQEKLIYLKKDFYIKKDLKKHLSQDKGLTLEEIEIRSIRKKRMMCAF